MLTNHYVPKYVKTLEESGSLTWKVAIKNGGAWAGSPNRVLEPANRLFKDFLDAASLVPESKTITCTLIQEDPKVAIQVCLCTSLTFF